MAGIVDKRDWQSSHRADFRHFPGDNRAKRTEFVSASLKPPAEAEAMQLFDWLSTEQRAMYKPPPADFKRTGLAHSERAGARAETAALLAASNSAPALQRKERPTSTYLEAFKDHRQPPLPLHHPREAADQVRAALHRHLVVPRQLPGRLPAASGPLRRQRFHPRPQRQNHHAQAARPADV